MRLVLWGAAACSAWAAWCGVVVSPDTLDFGTLWIGQPRTQSVVIANSGNAPLTLLGAEVRQWVWGGFSVSVAAPQVLEPGQSARVEVTAHFVHNLPCQGLLLLRLSCVEAEWTHPCLLQAYPQDPDTVYAHTDGLWGEALRRSLQELVQQQRVFPYDSARHILFFEIDNRGGTVQCAYTGRSIRVPPMPSPTVFSVEHSWPRSYGSDTLPPLSDLHHLFPTLTEANERRSNLRFGRVRTVLWELGGSRYGLDSTGAEVFEPRDQHKGDAARAVFYIALRYGNLSGWLTAPYEVLLRRWHAQDTVDEGERERTRRIAYWQGRANPFVERPQLLERIFRLGGSAAFPEVAQVLLSDTVLEYRGSEPSWELRLGILNVGWATAQLRAVELLQVPEGMVVRPRLLDSLIAPGTVGWVVLQAEAMGTPSGDVRVRLRFAAGVRPLELRIRLAPTGVPESRSLPVGETEELVLHWEGVAPCGAPRLTVFTVTGQAVVLEEALRCMPDGSLEARLQRQRLPRGFLLFGVEVGQRMLWTWRLNP